MPWRTQEGQLYNAEDGRKALRDVFALGLFDNVQVFPKQNARDEAKVRGWRPSLFAAVTMHPMRTLGPTLKGQAVTTQLLADRELKDPSVLWSGF